MQTESVTIKIHSHRSRGSHDVLIPFNWGFGSLLILALFSIGIIAQSSVLQDQWPFAIANRMA